MTEKISVLMDGELDDKSAAQAIGALAHDREAREAWNTYHLISDAMRDSRMLSPGFAARVARALEAEPTVMAPAALAPAARSPEPRWFALSAAASVAAVALVGWLAFAPQPQPQVPVAAAAKVQAQAEAKPAAAKPALVPLPSAASDYLLAHQGFSPRVSLQGMAAYVRTVSEPAQEARR